MQWSQCPWPHWAHWTHWGSLFSLYALALHGSACVARGRRLDKVHTLGTHPAPAAPCARAHTRAHSDARLVDLVGAPVGEGVDHPAIIMAKLLDVEACCDTWLPTLIKQRIRMRPAQSDKNEILPSRD